MARLTPTQFTICRSKAKRRNPNTLIYIYCNGAQTEFNYFTALTNELRLSSVKIISKDRNRLSLVEKVLGEMKRKDISPSKDTQVWVVFDVDALPKGDCKPNKIIEQVNDAQTLCENNNIKYAISNDCFEHWFLLHFSYCQAHIHRDEMRKKLKTHLNCDYEKDLDMYSLISCKTTNAITNAEKLHNDTKKKGMVTERKPYTGVYLLVKELQKISEENEK